MGSSTLAPLIPFREVEPSNSSLFNVEDIKMDSNFAFLLCSLVSTMAWVIYITYYNSRVAGYFITKLLNRLFVSEGYLRVGSFTLCALSGKIMFRDIVYITYDYTVRIQDGWMIFRWWRAYVPKDVSEDLSHSDTRLSVMLNGFECHIYNRCAVYGHLERVFGLDGSIFPCDNHEFSKSDPETQSQMSLSRPERPQPGAGSLGKSWRDLIPVIKVDVSSGRFVFGNRLVPTTLSILVEDAHFVYSTKPAASRLDHFMHFAKCKAENFKVILAPSPKYTGMADDPPRYMGEGFVVLSSNNVDLYYYMDEPGVVPQQPEMVRLANGDIVESGPPTWGMDIKCGKGTDFSYGPWADRQREHLFKFFFPQDCQPLKVTKAPPPGEKRQVQSFDIRLSTLYDATIDVLFSKNKETNAVHVNVGPGSYLEVTMPWVVSPDGYTTKVTGQLLHLEATTSLQYRSLVVSETLEFTVRSRYPLKWNDHQEWLLNLTGCKATVWFIYAHKEFFQDMVNDWSSKARPDLLHFIPYTWRLTLLMKEFEFIMPCNEYNWVDCSSQSQENMCIAFCGDLFDFSFDLPFTDFLPATLPIRFWIQGESMDLSLYLPGVFTSRAILLSLDQNAKLLGRDGNIIHPRVESARKWRNICLRSEGWLDCWSVPIVALSINYTYHPMPPFGPPPQADITTPEKEEILLSPMRIPRSRKSPAIHQWRQDGCPKFDPTSFSPDKVSLELEIGPSVLLVYGAWLRGFVNLKENIFGDDQMFTDMNEKPEVPVHPNAQNSGVGINQSTSENSSTDGEIGPNKKNFDPRLYRPLEVIVSITMHDIQAHLVKNCNENDPPCPIILLERFGFEMKKGYKETQLQLLLSPAILLSTDKVSSRTSRERHLNQGHLMLSGFQLRGHAMFSDEGRRIDQETVEYAWLLEIQLGKLTGKMTMPQLHHLVTGLETLLLLTCDSENKLVPPHLPPACHHGLAPIECAESDPDGSYRCPSADEIKYRMVRVAVDALDLYILEAGTAMNFWASPIRFSTCNLHGNQVKSGMTGVLPSVKVRQFIATANHFGHTTGGGGSNTNTTGSGRSQHGRSAVVDGSELWLEVGVVSFGPLILEAAVSLSNTDKNLHLVQHKYLKIHDERSKRLWFLWTGDGKTTNTGKCGCIGGCIFFGQNCNGQRFFKPSRQDATDGVNIAAFRINETGKDPGFGQSILHDNQLVFRTPPYTHDVSIHDTAAVWNENKQNSVNVKMGSGDYSPGLHSRVERSRSVTESHKDSPTVNNTGSRLSTATPSPVSCVKTSLGRRFSYTSSSNRTVNNGHSRDVPYARLLDSSPTSLLPPKLDSDSRLNTNERTRSILSVPEAEPTPKSSVSDSKLAVDYFNSTAQQYNALINSVNSPQVGNNVIQSDSDHSIGQEEKLVERTMSMCSENQSEAFFSAEEELIGGALPSSRSSSLRHSVGIYRQDSTSHSRKRFGSDMSIVTGGSATLQSSSGENKTRLSTHRSDHEIHTPEHRSNVRGEQNLNCNDVEKSSNVGLTTPLLRHGMPRSVSPRCVGGLDSDLQDASAALLDSSDTHSISSTSFISAVSSQEDLALVNLHMQVNKPIIESPLLMSSYVNHLSQVGCSNWAYSSLPSGSDAFTVPLFQRTNDGRLVYVGSKYTPRFETLTEGFTSLKMINRGKDGGPSTPPPPTKTPTHPYNWDQSEIFGPSDDNFDSGIQEELLSLRNESGTRTTVVVNMKGDVDVMISPLVLESLQRFIDALTPTLISLHPLSVLNHLHFCCMERVEAANVLKKDKYLSQLQGGGSKRSTAERTKPGGTDGVNQPHSIYEECIATQIQGTVILPKVNIALLQASVVEEVISFSALDNIRDLTCVSLLAVSLESITARFHCAKQAREVVQTFHRPAVLPSGHKKGGLVKSGKAIFLGHQTSTVADVVTGEPVYIETSEKQQEESVITLNISKVHGQLRRLRNECSILKDAVITAIPSHCSRVMFTTCSRVSTPPQSWNNDNEDKVLYSYGEETPLVSLSEEKMGFIMFECGLEGVSFKVVKRSKFDKEDDVDEIKPTGTENETNYTDSVRSKEELESVVVVTEHAQQSSSGNTQNAPNTGSNQQPESADNNVQDTTTDANSSVPGTNAVAVRSKDGNASSCVIQVQQVWFNFAAPPRAPITRKIDYTRLDWNLLSTASPAINAWMNPSNRFAIRVVHMLRCRYRRCTAIVTCLMAEALDIQSIHMPSKSRYGRFTPLSKALQEDPSCQLCCVLQKYLLQNTTNIEDNLKESDLPHLSTLRQGVIVLSRQWKNILYTPLLLEHNFKSKHLVKPFNVTFAVPDPDEDSPPPSSEPIFTCSYCGEMLERTDSVICQDYLDSVTQMSAGVNRVNLTSPVHTNTGTIGGAPGGPAIAIHSPPTHSPPNAHLTLDSLIFSSPTSPNSLQLQQAGGGKKKSLLPSHPPASSRASIVFPLLGSTNPFIHHQHRRVDSQGGEKSIGYCTLKEDHKSHSSHPSLYSGGVGVPVAINQGTGGNNPDSQHSITSLENQNFSPGGSYVPPASKEGGEDLYTWMAKQQEFLHPTDDKVPICGIPKGHYWPNSETKIAPMNVTSNGGTFLNTDYLLLAAAGYSLYPMHDSLRLLDAHLIFEPLLSSLGVMPQQMISSIGGGSNSLDSWGSNLSLIGGMEAMRIDIVVSEFGKPQEKKKPSKPQNTKSESKFWLEIPPETPAFLCERVGVELEMCRLADMTIVEDLSRQRRNMLYVSRGQLKKNSNTTLNLSVSVRYIAQQVNMPLLRLLHQISNMYQNVKETQSELREQQPDGKNNPPKTPPANNSGLDLPELSLPLLSVEMENKLPIPRSPSETSKPSMTGPLPGPLTANSAVVLSPSSSVRSPQRHQTFAQRLRSSSKSVRGYINLGDTQATGVNIPSPTGEKDAVILTPRCWKTVYYLLDLYATMPETKTVAHSRFSVAGDVSEGYKGNRKYDLLPEVKTADDVEKGENTCSTPVPAQQPKDWNLVNTVAGERTRLVVLAVARIHRTRLLATLSGLKLEAEITNLHSSLTVKKKTRPPSLECSLTGHVGRTMIVLLEGVAPNQQTVVKVTVGKSQALYSSVTRRLKDKNSGLLTIGAVSVDIPQHPVALHGMMTRGSKQLSSTLQELRVNRTSSRMSRGTTADDVDFATQQSPGQTRTFNPTQTTHNATTHKHQLVESSPLLQPLVMQFSVVLQSLSITAALLPSLQAQYKMDQVTSTGVTGSKAKFIIDLPHHSLSFSTKVQVTEANLPSEASIELPKVHVSAEYVQDGNNTRDGQFADGVVLRQGNYISAVADIGVFEHSLTTDLLNHLVFVQKVFMKEVNEVVQKVYGGEKPVPLWLEDAEETTSSTSAVKRILFSLIIRIKRIQLTATTPTNCAVRLETGAVDFQLSNRVQNVSGCTQPNAALKIFGKAAVDVNLSLGQLIKNVLFEEAEPEFQQFAFFKTRIGLRNAFQGEMVGTGSEDKEVVLITLKRPLVYIQPIAVDKAILVWLNYKNAYEYWSEQRSNLNKEVLTATQQVFEKVPFEKLTSSPHLGTLFLQLTVEDMGICIPLNPLPPPTSFWGINRQLFIDSESCAAVVVTLESTSISACSSGSLVSKGRFVGLCLRFADDFETSLDDWKPDTSESAIAMNLCVVSEGTYEVCSRTIAAQRLESENAKWFLNVQWAMEGVDIHLDVNIGKQLSALGHTLTMLTGVQEDEAVIPGSYDSDEQDTGDNVDASQESMLMRRNRNLTCDSLPAFAFDPSLDAKKRSKLIEKEMNEQAKIINDLRALGASHGTIELEMKRLQELEAMVFKDFRRDMIQKLRRQSIKSAAVKSKLGISSKTNTARSRSFIVPSPTLEHHLELESPDETRATSITSGSFDSSPRSGPSRSASLRTTRGLGAPKVTFFEQQQQQPENFTRQSSLPSASSELSLPVDGELIDWPSPEGMPMFRMKISPNKSSFDSTDGSTLLLVEPDTTREQSGLSPTCNPPTAPTKPHEPNIDFELDVKVLINSGKCVLHTKDQAREDELKLLSRMKKERSCSGGMFDFPPSSPNLSRRSHKDRHNASTSTTRLRHNLQMQANAATVAQLVDLTIFHIPGLDVKVHYESKTLPEESEGTAGRKSGTKKASLFAWTTLQSIPEETIISPHILEFLEQTLEPIPAQGSRSPFPSTGPVNSMFTMDRDDDTTPSPWITPGGQYVYASFPVDVIVYFHMQPSTFRFSCLPVSRVECMLQLPSLDIVFSSKRPEAETSGTSSSGSLPAAMGGLSVTGCLADFSVYIFHPYGGKKTGLKEPQWSPLSDSERKDSLSVNVEFVKFHLSRSRKTSYESIPLKGTKSSGSDLSQAIIRFSTIVDIGSASFKYDMRRLTEILAFPKAWYRRSIVRRLFLGDLSTMAVYSEEDSSPEHDMDSERSPMLLSNREKIRLNMDGDLNRHRLRSDKGKSGSSSESASPSDPKPSGSAWETLVLFAVNFKRLNVHMNMGNVMGNVTWLTKDFRSEGRLSIGSTGHKNMFIGLGLGGSSLDAKCGIVGGAIELSKIDTFILIREDPGMEPDHTIGLKLFALELRLDYMGTGVLMCRVSSLDVSLRDEWKMTNRRTSIDAFNPTRRPAMIFMHGDLGWDQLQIMISKSTTVDLMKMFYKLDEFFSQQFKSSKRVFSSLGSTRSKNNSGSGSSFRKRGQHVRKRGNSSSDAPQPPQQSAWVVQDAKHHRHWQKVFAVVAGLHLSTIRLPLPDFGSVLGGTMELHGTNISLACFHGINFKSKSWALFSLKEPFISFATEAQEVQSNDSSKDLDVHIVQTLTFSLGMTGEEPHVQQHESMATVCKVSRNVLFPPQFRTLQEWFHYAFACSEIDAVDRFPSLEKEKMESNESSGTLVRSRTSKSTDPNHTREVIFALPSLQLHLKTEHLQSAFTPEMSDEKPLVECSFVTEFEDHIFVTVDAEAFFFLHDLITSYIREKDRVSNYGQSMRANSPEPAKHVINKSTEETNGGTETTADSSGSGALSDEEKKRKSFEPGEMFTKDWRTFHCKTWHLEPTVRLLSWGGKSIEPYGVDYILQKLGFAHARTTIPKWMQRGFMDPLDKVLSVLVLNMVQIIREDPKTSSRYRHRSNH